MFDICVTISFAALLAESFGNWTWCCRPAAARTLKVANLFLPKFVCLFVSLQICLFVSLFLPKIGFPQSPNCGICLYIYICLFVYLYFQICFSPKSKLRNMQILTSLYMISSSKQKLGLPVNTLMDFNIE